MKRKVRKSPNLVPECAFPWKNSFGLKPKRSKETREEERVGMRMK